MTNPLPEPESYLGEAKWMTTRGYDREGLVLKAIRKAQRDAIEAAAKYSEGTKHYGNHAIAAGIRAMLTDKREGESDATT